MGPGRGRAFVGACALGVGLFFAGLSSGEPAPTEAELLLEATEPVQSFLRRVEWMTPHVEACVADAGFDGFEWNGLAGANFSRADPTDDRIGFGVTAFDLDNLRLARTYEALDDEGKQAFLRDLQPGVDPDWSAEERDVFEETKRACAQQAAQLHDARGVVGVDAALVESFKREVAARITTSEAIVAARGSWQTCMAEHGHPFVNELGVVQELRREVVAVLSTLNGPDTLDEAIAGLEAIQQREFEIGRVSDRCSADLVAARRQIRSQVATELTVESP